NRATPLAIDSSIERVTNTDTSVRHTPHMRMRRPALLRVLYDEAHAGAGNQLTSIPNLTAGFRIERGAIQDDFALLTRAQRINGRTRLQQRDDMPSSLDAFVTLKRRARIDRSATTQIRAELARVLRASPLLFHRDVESC